MTNMVAINNKEHAGLKVTNDALNLSANQHLVPVVVSELNKLVVHYPVVITKLDDWVNLAYRRYLGLKKTRICFGNKVSGMGFIFLHSLSACLFMWVPSRQIQTLRPTVCCASIWIIHRSMNKTVAHFSITWVNQPLTL